MPQKIKSVMLLALTAVGCASIGYAVGRRAIPEKHVKAVLDATGKPMEVYVYEINRYGKRIKNGGALRFDPLSGGVVTTEFYRGGVSVDFYSAKKVLSSRVSSEME